MFRAGYYYGVIFLSYKRSRTNIKVRRFIILLLLLVLFFNAGDIARFFLPVPYREIIFREAAGAGIDSYLLAAIVKTESNFNSRAVSPKGARGLMQIMPETGRWVADRNGIRNFEPDLLFNPEYNIKLGARYVAELYKEYDGDTVLMLAAYNAGRGNVNKWLGQKWTGEKDSIDQIPFPETRQFIRKVLFYQQAYSYLYVTPAEPEK